jgi:hypothetical protein
MMNALTPTFVPGSGSNGAATSSTGSR